ncbi:NDP-hexose 2,3-dehydratase family protein [Micromonospora sp. KC213]|uniref:NDP-hexose 2,3-dehydratase family protein n=1 Tax=Micromonospora sp. KC213 TaxID=2530378 RepID=UPI001049E4F3|nr:NDP-hexose 2,3-dehydratase family protein [Micromonospora sp. KC213]TDC42872.1 NDP-hexose 2,3-dehydratase [Micromonospora sp. KC213]
MFRDLSEFHEWFDSRARANRFRVTPTGLDALQGWTTDPDTGNIAHASGRFFTVEGLRVRTNSRQVTAWDQPIIIQPETGILGILVKDFDGVPHFLMQAKMEPGNINLLQLSPTVQATRSNYTRVHRGSSVPYLEYFVAARRHQVLFDSLQSEQGSWFLGKRNRNMIVYVDEDVPVRDDFCWLSLPQLRELLSVDNLVNMDSRTVLSGMPSPRRDAGPGHTGDAEGWHPMKRVLSWFTEAKSNHRLDQQRIPLSQVAGWRLRDSVVEHDSGHFFRIIGVNVQATNREVREWSQPMLAPCGRGLVAFLVRDIAGVRHVLVRALSEAGTLDVVELAPTVQCTPDNYRDLPTEQRPPFLDYALAAPPDRIRLDVVHSEEGGRFYHAETRYLVVETAEDLPYEEPEGHLWVSVPQLAQLVRHSNYLNVSARSLLCCLRSESWMDTTVSADLVAAW